MNGVQFLEAALREVRSLEKGGDAPGAEGEGGFLETLLETDALRDSGLTKEDLEAWIAAQGGKGMPLGGHELPAGIREPGAGRPDADLPVDAGEGERDALGAMADTLGLAAVEPRGSDGGRGTTQLTPLLTGEDLQRREDPLQTASRARQASLQAMASGDGGMPRMEPEPTGGQDGSRYAQMQFQQAMQQMAPQQPASVPTYTVGQPMDQPGWGQAMGERLMVMAGQEVQQARIQVHPREFGPLDVSIQMRDDKTTILFQAQNPAAREALESELPRLRTMLSDNGIEDAEVEVRDQERDPAGERADGGDGGLDRGLTGEDDAPAEDDAQAGAGSLDDQGAPRSLVDHYA